LDEEEGMRCVYLRRVEGRQGREELGLKSAKGSIGRVMLMSGGWR
jgi:hypothetical protein